MSALDTAVANLNQRFAGAPTLEVLEYGLTHLGRAAVVSSFGAESAVLLHMLAQIDRSTTVLFVDTEMLFAETLAYQQDLAAHLGLTGVLVLRAGRNAQEDPDGTLHMTRPDACCELRKTAPLHNALRAYDTWISGRKRAQSGTRAHLDLFEADGDRMKVNPLAFWDSIAIRAYFDTHDLPRHPLVSGGFPSIGCAPCTTPVREGEDPRAGRWRGQEKTECGIHFKNGQAVRERATP